MRIRTLLAFLTPAVLGALGCTTGGDSVIQPKNDIHTLPWKVTLNYKGITMAVGQSVPLTATATYIDGTEVSGPIAVTYATTDSSLHVDATGKITATQPRDYVLVYASLQDPASGYTLADTARVRVTDVPYTFSDFKLLPDGPLAVGAGSWRNYDAVLYTAGGDVLLPDGTPDPGPIEPTTYRYFYPYTAYTANVGKKDYSLYTGGGVGNALGDVKVVGSAWLYGQVYSDSLTFHITWPDSGRIYLYQQSYTAVPSPTTMSQTDLTIGQNGVVIFHTYNTTKQDTVTFADQVNVIDGNISPVSGGYPGSVVRFPNKGTFTYNCTCGYSGKITVVDP